MDLNQLAQIGEFVGGGAVLVTLVYLALQVRLGNDLARSEAVYNAVNTWSVSRQMLLDDGLSGILAKAQNDEELSAKQKIQLAGFLSELTYSSWAAYTSRRFSRAETAPEAIARQIRGSRVMRDAWDAQASELRDYKLGAFAEEVERLL